MEEIKTAIESAPVAAQPVAPSTTTETEDAEARFRKLEEEKNNYKAAFLKEKSKNKSEDLDEGDDEKVRRIVDEQLANSRLAEIAREQDGIIQKALKENKELKLAHLNKTTAPASMGTHSESQVVQDTSVTPEQMAYFKSKNYTDKDIERYKHNLRKNTR